MRAHLPRALLIASWAAVVLAALALLDVWRGPAHVRLILVVAIAPWLLFAVWPVLVGALVRRRWILGVAAAAIVAVQVFVLLPSYAPWHSPPKAVPGTSYSVFDANVKYDNDDISGIGRQILADRPDLVTLEEVSFANLPTLQRTGALAAYPYTFVQPATTARGYAIYSKLPLSDVRQPQVGGAQFVAAVVTGPGGPNQLLVVHTVSPPGGVDQWSAELTAIAAAARVNARSPLLIVGDFNATLAMRQMRAILHAGVTDGATEDGKGWDMTWAANGRSVVPVMRIDHALVTRSLTVTDYRLGHASGSDHRPMLFDVGTRA